MEIVHRVTFAALKHLLSINRNVITYCFHSSLLNIAALFFSRWIAPSSMPYIFRKLTEMFRTTGFGWLVLENLKRKGSFLVTWTLQMSVRNEFASKKTLNYLLLIAVTGKLFSICSFLMVFQKTFCPWLYCNCWLQYLQVISEVAS